MGTVASAVSGGAREVAASEVAQEASASNSSQPDKGKKAKTDRGAPDAAAVTRAVARLVRRLHDLGGGGRYLSEGV